MPAPLRQVRAVWRLLRVLLHVLHGAWTIRWTFPALDAAQRQARVQRWAQALLRHLGIALEVRGTPDPQRPLLLVSNHISWVDIAVIHAVVFCRFISKDEVRGWPVLGLLASGAGTLFIARASRRDALRVVHHMVEQLRAGDVLAVFPEGTTGDGSSVLPFHANLLQAALAAPCAVQPLALQFRDQRSGLPSRAPCYVGDDTLLQSLWRTLCSSDVCAQLHFGVSEFAQGRERRAWAGDLQASVQALCAPLDDARITGAAIAPAPVPPTRSH